METVKNWLNRSAGQDDKLQKLKRKVRALHARAEDVNDEIKQEELQPGKRRKREVDIWLKDVDEVANKLQRLEVRGKDVSALNLGNSSTSQTSGLTEQIGELISQGSFPRGFTIYDHDSSSVALVTADIKIADNSLHDNKRKIKSWLLQDGVTCTIGVYGPGGVGKTMLLKEFHNELLERSEASWRIYWISVSHGITLPMLQDKIAEAMGLTYLLTENNAIKKAASLYYELKRRNDVLLLLDDVWEHFSSEDVGIPVGEGNSCKLILTTRSLIVCRRMNCKEVIKVEPLSKEKSWELFARVLGRRDEIPSEIHELAELVAAECAGLPLGLIVMAGSMREVNDVQEWRNTLDALRNSIERQPAIETDIFPVLKLSYDRLNDDKLRLCFLLCALYPKYGHIERDELIMLFHMEGLLENYQNTQSWQKQLNKGHSMLNKLENVCLLEKQGNRHVKMHNFIRDMAIRITHAIPRFMISAGAELRRIPSGRRWSEDLDKASLMHNSLSEILPETIPVCPHLTTLLIQQNPFTKLPCSFFLHMTSLKVLNLSRTSIKRLPNSISDLISLRALLLEFCQRLHFVPSLMQLTNLRYLNLSFCWSMKDVPQGMEQLANLIFLDLEGSKDLCQLLSKSLCTFSNIQCLKLDPDVQSISGGDMVKLRHLERVEGCRISDVFSFNRYVNTQHFQKLDYYEFLVGTSEYKRFDSRSTNEERRVILCSGSLKEGSKGDLFIPPENTQNLQIHNSEMGARSLFEALPSLARLTTLKKILIRRCRVLEVIWSPRLCFEAALEAFIIVDTAVVVLQHLKELNLTDLHDFTGLVKEGLFLQQGVFSNLKILVFKYCPKIKKLFTSNLLNGNLDNLQELEVEGCEELEQIVAFQDDDGLEGTIDFEGYNNIESDLIRLPNLRVLLLRRLPNLTSICHGGVLGKGFIERIIVEYCAKINHVVMNSVANHNLRSIREVKVAGCQNLQEIFASSNYQCKENEIYDLPNLKALELDDLPCLSAFIHGSIPVCGAIEQMTFKLCPRLKRLPLSIPLQSIGEQLGPLSLQEIKADRKWWESLEWDDPAYKKILLPFTKLSEAAESSISVFEEACFPRKLNKLENKSSETNVNTSVMSSCLSESSVVQP